MLKINIIRGTIKCTYIQIKMYICQNTQSSYRFRDSGCGSTNMNGIVGRSLCESQPSVSHCRDRHMQ